MKEDIKIKIDIIPSLYVKKDGTFDQEAAKMLAGKFAGVCYDQEGFNHLVDEPIEKTQRRIDLTLNNGHHSVYDHISITFNMQNIPKILAMVINNEKQYTTSEKSARYTIVEKKPNSFITDKEVELYNKWLAIFMQKIKDRYLDAFTESKVKKLAGENARYLITVFMPTEMIYTTTFRQINYLVSWMKKYITEHNPKNEFESKLAYSMEIFVAELKRLDVLEEGLLKNDKNRSISLFGNEDYPSEDYFGEVYVTNYKGTFPFIAHAMRHRTLDYQITFLKDKEYFIPPIIIDDEELVKEWLQDIKSLDDIIPQGTLVMINEKGKYEDFILKCKERLCSTVFLETNNLTRMTLLKYQQELEKKKHYLTKDIIKYTKGARCTFPDFKCSQDCNFKEGKILDRII